MTDNVNNWPLPNKMLGCVIVSSNVLRSRTRSETYNKKIQLWFTSLFRKPRGCDAVALHSYISTNINGQFFSKLETILMGDSKKTNFFKQKAMKPKK